MSVVKVVTLHANVASGLVLEAWVVEDAAAEARGAAEAQGAAVAVAQDIVGAQAMVEGATAHAIGLPGSGVTAGLHHLPAPEVSAGLHRLPAREVSAGLHRLLAPGVSAGHHRLLAPGVSASHHRLLASGATAGPLHSHPSVKSPHMPMTREHLVVPQMLEGLGYCQFASLNVLVCLLDCHAVEYASLAF
jgi:hypothetical protein